MATINRSLTLGLLLVALIIGSSFICTKKSDNISNSGFVLVELFTSEGCSSCPPADKLVAKINKEFSGKPVYVLAYHVDYWNRLGWKDPYSSADFSKRQGQYSKWMNLKGVYTPQIVVNGKSEFVGSNERRLREAISDYSRKSSPAFSMDIAGISNNTADINYHFDGDTKKYALYIACVQNSATTKVERGENGGRTLSHVNVVRDLKQISVSPEGKIKLSLPAGIAPVNLTIIGFVQNNLTGEIIAAAKTNI